MLRIRKLVQLTSQKLGQNALINTLNRTGRQRFVCVHRFYSEGHDGRKPPGRDRSGACPPDPAPCKPPKPVLPECKTIHPLHPCTSPGKPYPMDYDCPTENLMDKLPQRQVPFDVHDGRRKRYYFIVLAIGTLALLITSYIAYEVIQPKPIFPLKKKRKERPKVILKNPLDSSNIPKNVKYLLIGGGTASFSAFRAIKSEDPTAKVLVVSSEGDFPYMRPPLSKEMWFNSNPNDVESLIFKQWNGTERSIFYEPEDFYVKCEELDDTENGGVAVARGWSIKRIDVVERKAYLEDDYEISYDKCLIATGAKPKNLDIFSNAEPKIRNSVTLFREVFDFQELYQIIEEVQSVAVVGGGFLGSEIACAMARAKKDLRVSQVFKEPGNMGKVLPEYLSSWTTEKVKQEGVNVVPEAEVIGVKFVGNQVQLTLNNDEELKVDHVIVAVGVEPNTSLAEQSDLEVDPELGGYLVNTELQARSNLYIAGDCACFYDTKFGRRRVEHHDHAVVSGRLAGENMTGAGKPYWHQSMFWSDLGPDVGYEAIGIVDSKLPTVGVFAKATELDTPKAVVGATDEAMRCNMEETECSENKDECNKANEVVPPECKDNVRKDPELKALAEQIKKQSKSESDEDYGKGVVFYLKDDIVVGIVLWNVFNRMNIARQVLKEERKYEDLNEVAKLFNIHEE